MKAAIKYDYKIHEYSPCAVPDEAVQYSVDPNMGFPCARCAHKVRYADSYTSLFLLAENGFGYCICKECMQKEIEELHDTHLEKRGSKS